MKRFLIALVALLPLAVNAASISKFSSISVAATNFQSEAFVTNGLTLGGVRNTSWPAGGIVGTVSNNVASAGLLAVDSTKTNGIAATFAHVTNALGVAVSQAELGYLSGVTSAIQGQLDTKLAIRQIGTLTHSGTITLTNLAGYISEADIVLTGVPTFATSALSAGSKYVLYGRNTAVTNYSNPVFPAWNFQGGAPSTITAGKAWTLSISSRGTVDTNVWAAYTEAQ